MEPEPPEARAEPILSEPEEIQIQINFKKLKTSNIFFKHQKSLCVLIDSFSVKQRYFSIQTNIFSSSFYLAVIKLVNISDRAKIKP